MPAVLATGGNFSGDKGWTRICVWLRGVPAWDTLYFEPSYTWGIHNVCLS